MSDRERSASPRRDRDGPPRPKKTKTTGFKWKEKKPAPEDPLAITQEPSNRLERGYRNRSPRRDSYRDRETKSKDSEGTPRSKDRTSTSSKPSKPSEPSTTTSTSTSTQPPPSKDDQWAAVRSTSTSKPKTKPSAALRSSEPMIVVNINDRLGTKAAIPCMASDSVKMFKAVVAAHIGRQPHEIMLKRQGERPFKDILTLEDYGVSNGVQLDLEIDTGD